MRRSNSPIPAGLLQRLRLGPTPSPDDGTGLPDDDDMAAQLAAYTEAMGELAPSHPQAYETFVRAQDEAAAALAAASHSDIGPRVIMPETGFVVRASIMPPHPPVRISEAGATPDSATSQPLLVNVVSHHAVQRPVVPSPSGAPVLVEEERGWSADLGIQVSLLVGAPCSATTSGGGTTVDVLVSPWVVREALKHRLFQAQLVNLALEWVAQETGLGVRADGPCVVLPAAVCSYWDSEQGGMGKPRPFVVDEAVARQQLAPEERPERALQDPRSLLAALRRHPPQSTSAAAAATAPALLKPRPPCAARRVPISIEEEDSDEEADDDDAAGMDKEPQLALKRGFLLD